MPLGAACFPPPLSRRFTGGFPYRIRFCTSRGNFRTACRDRSRAPPRPARRLRRRNVDPDPGPGRHRRAGASSRRSPSMDRNRISSPGRCTAGQAPYGELKLKERGSSCGTEIPQSLQASFSEKTCSVPPTTATVTSPLANFSDVAIDCSSRDAMPGFTSRRSTTTSMV